MEVEQQGSCTELLDLVIDGQANQTQELELTQHLALCEDCKKEYLISRSIQESLKNNVKFNATPTDLVDNIQSKLLETVGIK